MAISDNVGKSELSKKIYNFFNAWHNILIFIIYLKWFSLVNKLVTYFVHHMAKNVKKKKFILLKKFNQAFIVGLQFQKLSV